MNLHDIKGILKVFFEHLREDIEAYGWDGVVIWIAGAVVSFMIVYFIYQLFGLI